MTEHPVNNVKRPGMAAPSFGSGFTPLDPSSEELRRAKVDDQSEFRSSANTGMASAPPLQDVVETCDTRALRSPFPGEAPEAREEYGSTALAPLPPGPPPGHTGWTPSDGTGSEHEGRRELQVERLHHALLLPSARGRDQPKPRDDAPLFQDLPTLRSCVQLLPNSVGVDIDLVVWNCIILVYNFTAI